MTAIPRAGAAALLIVALAAPASAANKEHLQLAADIRMLQEQQQQLQILLGTIAESIKAINGRLDDQTSASRKAFADQKLLIDNLTSDLRVVREKVDDNNVRISSLTQELDQIRQMVQSGVGRAPATPDQPGPGAAPGGAPSPATPSPSPAPAAPPAIGTSPQRLYEMAWSDYTSGQWDLAIQGFESYIRTFPKSDQAPDAQVKIGNAYMNSNQYDKAVEAYDAAIRNYPASPFLAEAYYKKGLSLAHLGQADRAREALQTVIKNYPNDPAATLARQQLDRLGKP